MKHVYKYAQEIRSLAQAAIDELTESDVLALHHELNQLQNIGWMDWQISHNQDISEYLLATPSARQKRKSWQTMKNKLVLVFYYECQRAVKMLMMASDPALQAGGSYRSMVPAASSLFWELGNYEPEPWPFAIESPFSEA